MIKFITTIVKMYIAYLKFCVQLVCRHFGNALMAVMILLLAAGCSVKQTVPDAIVYAPMDCANKISIERFIQDQYKLEDDPRVKRHYKKVMWDLRTECGAIQQ